MKEIKLLSNIEEGCLVDKDLGAYKVITDGMDDIIIIKNYKYRDLKCVEVTSLDERQQHYKIVDIENHDTYIVKPLDTLKSIATLYKTSVDELKEINKLKSDKLFIGQVLKI